MLATIFESLCLVFISSRLYHLILTATMYSGVIIPFAQGKEGRLRELSNLTNVAP